MLGAWINPLLFGAVNASWIGLLLGWFLYRTTRRWFIIVLCGLLTIWPYYPFLLFDSDWSPWWGRSGD